MVDKNNKGYTLIELIVVIALIAILLSISLGGIASYIRYSQFKQNDEHARTIFSIVQNALTLEKNNGSLNEFKEFVEANCESVPIPEGGDINMYSRLYYLNIGENKVADKDINIKNRLKDLIGKYIYDEDIWNGAMCVELDPSDGVVKAVWYCRQGEELSYTQEDLTDGIIMIGNPNINRQKKRLGYYGTDELSAAAPEDIGKPVISYLRLDNEEVLDLNWAMSRKYFQYTRELNYNIKIYGDDNKPKLLVTLKGADLKNVGEAYTIIECSYNIYDSDGNEITVGINEKIPLVVYMGNQNDDIHIILDAIDLKVDNILINNGINSDLYKDSYSGMKIKEIAGIELNSNIFARVQAVGNNFNASAWKRSGDENLIMGQSSKSENFTLQNARHLYNMRFMEAYYDDKNSVNPSEVKDVTYRQTESFNWGGSNGIIAQGFVFDSETSITDINTSFPMLKAFLNRHTFSSNDKEIGELYLNYATENKVALFRKNEGNLKGLTLTNVKVEGNEYVASFCAENKGKLENLTTKKGSVKGVKYVGGILSYSRDNGVEISSLNNDADITGAGYVGGIIGDFKNGSIKESNNTGLILINDESSTKLQYFGGIVGDCGNATIENCSSSPENEDIIKIDSNTSKADISKYLKGENVGGIAGRTKNCVITNCQTGEGYVLGSEKVGGIVGFYEEGEADIDGNGLSNNSMIIGESYVGGIVGKNNSNGIIKNWENKGIVCATIKYAGGITGLNNGEIINCTTSADTSSTEGNELLNIARNIGGDGDYIGGIAGKNEKNGSITFSNAKNGSCVIAGNNYIGGIIGYNEGYVDNCSTDGAYISGNDSVGGMFGYNSSVPALEHSSSSEIVINKIYANSYVGGYIGYNKIENHNNDIEVNNIKINNILGSIESTGNNIGGVIGYNDTVCKIIINNCNINLDSITANINGDTSVISGTNVGGIVGGNNENIGSLVIKDSINVTNINAYGITNANDAGEEFAYCGGIIGRVTKNSIVENCAIGKNIDIIHYGTYFGAIAEVNEGIIRNCTVNHILGDSSMNNIGGIAGLNINVDSNDYNTSGYIENCKFSGSIIGNDNVGGIVSVNKGKVLNVKVEGSITGYGENTGGIIGYNIGESDIANSEVGSLYGKNIINCEIFNTGSNVGGAIGLNGGIIDDAAVSQGNKISISGNDNVGGFIGKDITVNTSINDKIGHISGLENNVEIKATGGNAGGIIGSIEGNGFMVSNCSNYGDISANVGDAGGITAYNKNSNTIDNCINYANVMATKSQRNGAIAGGNDGRISNSLLGGNNTITITGHKYIGGIVGENEENGVIINSEINCKLELEFDNADSNGSIGGITGINKGRITNVTTNSNSKITINTDESDISTGGGIGYNSGIIDGNNKEFDAEVIVANGLAAPIGGIAGVNVGTVKNYTFSGKITAEGSADYGIGGIVGVNGVEGNIEKNAIVDNCKINDNISRKLTRSTSTSVNNHRDSTDYTINTTINEAVRVGGIVGYNYENGTVSNSTLINCYIKADYGYAGGIVGHNYGIVEGCKAENTIAESDFKNLEGEEFSKKVSNLLNNKPDLNVKLYKYQGDLGGLVGRNEVTGQVANSSTGRDWFVIVDRLDGSNYVEATDNTCAGGIGYNCSNYNIEDVVNNADVSKLVNSGTISSGIIGRQENITSDTFIINNCINYGDIYVTANRAGGVIAQWKYNGGTVSHCKNYGKIRANSTATGGMVGSFYGLSQGQNVTIAFSDNLGEVGMSNKGESGGIVGDTNGAKSANLHIYKCTNAGAIYGNANYGGLIGRNNTLNANIEKSVNYYRFGSDKEVGHIAGNASNTIYTDNINTPTTKNNRYYVASGYTTAGSKNLFFGGESGMLPVDKLPIINIANKVTVTPDESNINWGITDAADKISISNLWDGNVSLEKGTAWKSSLTDYSWSSKNYTFAIDTNNNEGKGQKIGNIAIATQSGGDRFRYFYFNISFVTGEGDNLVEYYLTKNGDITTSVTSDNRIEIANESKNNIQWSKLSLNTPLDNVKGINIQLLDVRRENNGKEQYAVINEIEINKDETITVSGEADELVLFKSTDAEGNATYTGINTNQSKEIANIPYNPNDNSNKTTNAVNDGRTHYKDINTVLMNYFKSLMSATPVKPDNIVLKMESGKYTLTWNSAQGGYKYRVEVYIYINGEWVLKNTNDVEIGTTYSFRPEDSWFDENAQGVMCKVYTINGLYDEEKTDEENADYISEPGSSNEIALGNVLPTPKITFELIDSNGTYICKLLNKEDYANYNTDLIEITPGSTNSGFNNFGSFTVSEGQSSKSVRYTGDSMKSSFYINAQAKATGSLKGNVIDSVSYYAQTQLYSLNDLKSTAFTKWDSNNMYFTGVDPTELKLNATLNVSNTDYQNYRYTELVYDNIVYDSNYMRVTSNHRVSVGGMKTIDYGESVTLRSYPVGTQNMGISYGHTVVDGALWEDVIQYVNASGYVIRSIQDTNTYSVYYSALLDNKNVFGVQILEYSINMPKGVEDVILSDTFTNENNNFTFNWTDPNSSSSEYNVSIRGTKSVDGVDIYTLIYNNKISDMSITVDGSTWDYNKVKVEVSRIGQVNGNNHTLNMGSYAEKEYNISLNLPAVNRPSVKLVDKNDLKYTVNWKGYSVGTNEYNDFKGYEVWVYGDNGAGIIKWNVESDLLGKAITNTVIDLENYQGQEVKIAVIAKVSSEFKIYSGDSLPNLPQTLNVQWRKVIRDLVWNLSPSGDETVSISDFVNKGFTLTVKNPDTDEKGRYVVKGDVYDSENEGNISYIISDMNSNSPTLFSMINKNSSSLQEASYVFRNIPVDYAGQWLRVAVRSTSDSGISSIWSEVNALKLPSVRLNTPEAMQGTVNEEYDGYINGNVVGSIAVNQRSVYWNWDDNAKVYNIELKSIENSEENKKNITIIKNDNGYSVSCNGVGLSKTSTDDIEERYIIDDYGFTVTNSYNNEQYYFDTKAIIEIRENNCYIVLPDYTGYTLSNDISVNEEVKYSLSMEITGESDNKNFKKSNAITWARVYNNTTGEYSDGSFS